MAGTEQEKLAQRYAKLRAVGLCDLKFSLNVAEATVEQVCTDVNRVYDAFERGNYVASKTWNDSNRKV